MIYEAVDSNVIRHSPHGDVIVAQCHTDAWAKEIERLLTADYSERRLIECPGTFWRTGSWTESGRVTCSTCDQRIRVTAKGAAMPRHWLRVTVHNLESQHY
jgi:hypothetical protein